MVDIISQKYFQFIWPVHVHLKMDKLDYLKVHVSIFFFIFLASKKPWEVELSFAVHFQFRPMCRRFLFKESHQKNCLTCVEFMIFELLRNLYFLTYKAPS